MGPKCPTTCSLDKSRQAALRDLAAFDLMPTNVGFRNGASKMVFWEEG